jgi:hypothetical protein
LCGGFLEEYRWEPADTQVNLLQAEPPPVGDERWDALLAALAEHLCAQHDLAPPEWTESRVLRRAWFPAELAIQRVDALVWAPAAFRKHGVYLSAHVVVLGNIVLFRTLWGRAWWRRHGEKIRHRFRR